MRVIFSIQEMRSWDVTDLELLAFVCCGRKFLLATLLVSDQFLQQQEIVEVRREMYSPFSFRPLW